MHQRRAVSTMSMPLQDTLHIEHLGDPLKKELDVQSLGLMSSTCRFFNNKFKDDLAIKKLLHYTVLGRLDKVDEMLNINPKLTLSSNTITDLSDRTFYQITAFQYAAWALDIEMWDVILKYLDEPSACAQLKLLEENPEKYSKHGAHYDHTPSMRKKHEYEEYYDRWDQDQWQHYWQKEVGGVQRQYPAWLVYAMCEEGENVAWVENNMKNKKITRQYDKDHLRWWFNREYNGGKLGESWACLRGEFEGRTGGSKVQGYHSLYHDDEMTHQRGAWALDHDWKVDRSLQAIRLEELEGLKTKLDKTVIHSNNNSQSYKK